MPDARSSPPTPGSGWEWDPTLYAGSAGHYAVGREAYPPSVVGAIVGALGLDGTGRLLDVGCGPGSLTLPLAPHVGTAIGVDADADMIAEASRQAGGRAGVEFRVLRAEELAADLAPVDVVCFAQSFHWMRREQVAAVVREMLVPGGAVVHVGATTHRGVDREGAVAHPRPPWPAIEALIATFLGPVRRAGQGVLTAGTASGEAEIFAAAGFSGPERIELPGWTADRSVDQVMAAVHSLSGAAPHLFAQRLEEFDRELHAILAGAADDGLFCEEFAPVTLRIWRVPDAPPTSHLR